MTVDELVRKPYPVVALGMGLGLLACTVLLEFIVNYQTDAAQYLPADARWTAPFIEQPAWPPILAGALAGIAQVPMRILSADGLGGSTTFVTVIGTLSHGTLNLSPNNSLFNNPLNLFQLLNVYGFNLAGAAVAGLAVASHEDHVFPGEAPLLTVPFPEARLLVGSFLALFGARVAGGCTCGHGVSGTSELSLESFVAAGAIFGAGIATALVRLAVEGHD